MIPLPRDMLHATKFSPHWNVAARPIQVGLGRDPWKVAIASIMLCRTRREQMEDVLAEMLDIYQAPPDLAYAQEDALQTMLRPLGFHRQRARQMQRFSQKYTSTDWSDLRELPGVGKYVADSVGLFCFGCVQLESTDHALKAYADKFAGARTTFDNGRWLVKELERCYAPKDSFDVGVLMNNLVDLDDVLEETY